MAKWGDVIGALVVLSLFLGVIYAVLSSQKSMQTSAKWVSPGSRRSRDSAQTVGAQFQERGSAKGRRPCRLARRPDQDEERGEVLASSPQNARQTACPPPQAPTQDAFVQQQSASWKKGESGGPLASVRSSPIGFTGGEKIARSGAVSVGNKSARQLDPSKPDWARQDAAPRHR